MVVEDVYAPTRRSNGARWATSLTSFPLPFLLNLGIYPANRSLGGGLAFSACNEPEHVSSEYGLGYGPAELNKAIKAVSYSGLDLTALRPLKP
jgi:hypothetical protein